MDNYPSTTRVAAYPRVSTEEQKRHGLSIEDQTTALQEWADAHGLKIVDFYNDAGNSARKKFDKRPELLRLLHDVQADKIDLIIFTKLDRWFRNIAEYYKVQEILDAHNVQWKAIREDYDTSTASGRLKINIMLSVAQDEADRDSERIRAVFESKKANREPVTGHVPTGYLIEGKKIVKDPAWEPAVSCFFRSFLEYRSVELARQEVAETCGVLLTYKLADSMLRKEAYSGRFHGVDDMCPPYITKAEYAEIRANRRRTERKTDLDRVYLFTGMLFCAECGRRMGARAHRYAVKSGGYHERVAYNCPGRYFNNDCANNVNIGEADIEGHLLDTVDDVLEEYLSDYDSMTPLGGQRKNYQEERNKLKRKLSKLKDLYVNDIIDLELYRKDYEELNAKIDRLAEEEMLERPSPDPERLKAIFTPGWQHAYDNLSKTEKRNFWRTSIEKIVVSRNRKIIFSFR